MNMSIGSGIAFAAMWIGAATAAGFGLVYTGSSEVLTVFAAPAIVSCFAMAFSAD